MKRFFAQLKKLNVRRAVLSKTAARVFVGVIACLLWDRFLNSAGRLSVLGHAFMAVGLLFAAFAWMHYPVSFSHLTLPTERRVWVLVVALFLKKKKKREEAGGGVADNSRKKTHGWRRGEEQ